MRDISNIYTDLALEAASDFSELDGVTITSEDNTEAEIVTTVVNIHNANGEAQLRKPIGTYITLESPLLTENNPTAHEVIVRELADRLGRLHGLAEDAVVLVVGLGNWNVTPDALGPKVISRVLVTRHITGTDAVASDIESSVRPVCAVTPGVMGITGIETGEIVRGIVDRVRPDLVVAIDALAARSISRINCTIQMSNAGVNPGAGLGNKRMELNAQTLGVPVIAIGVPTVVDAATLISDSLDCILDDIIKQSGESSQFYAMLRDLQSQEKHALVQEALAPCAGNMFVTPKEVDAVIVRLAGIIANAINIALHPGITPQDINKYF